LEEILRDIVRIADGRFILIDTRDTPDRGWETMVFKCNRNGCVSGADWSKPLCERRYKTIEEANTGHAEIVNDWKL